MADSMARSSRSPGRWRLARRSACSASGRTPRTRFVPGAVGGMRATNANTAWGVMLPMRYRAAG
uniref:Uncharacterized protein n=1 Tax=Human herpesvirus 2 TaxID=10310 RepID=A0A481TYG9_HHV2|nr:hypothetical protein [Human alphaherpesvirus 2]